MTGFVPLCLTILAVPCCRGQGWPGLCTIARIRGIGLRRNSWLFTGLLPVMRTKLHFTLVLCVSWLVMFAGVGLVGQDSRSWGQESGRGARSEGEGRKPYGGRFFGGGDRGGDRGSDRGSERGGERDHERGRDGRSGRSEDSHRGDDRSSGSSSSSSGSSSRSSTPSSSSPSSSSSTKSSTDSKPASSSSSSSGSMAMTDYAKSLVKQYDKNGDMMLSADERKDLKGRAADADLNKDGTITIDELVAHLSPSSSSSSSTTPSPSSSSSTSSGKSGESDSKKLDAELAKRVLTGTAGGKEGDKRHSYRFSTAADRSASALPNELKSKDANGDGQVSMSEYGRSWSERSVAEFRKLDTNDDGVITAKEAGKKP